MTFDWEYYRDFTLWAERKTMEKAKGAVSSQDWLDVARFVRECGSVVRLFLLPWRSLVDVFRGKWYEIGSKVIKWAKSNPDPLKAARTEIERLYTEHGGLSDAAQSTREFSNAPGLARDELTARIRCEGRDGGARSPGPPLRGGAPPSSAPPP